jgi:hypothetical protein
LNAELKKPEMKIQIGVLFDERRPGDEVESRMRQAGAFLDSSVFISGLASRGSQSRDIFDAVPRAGTSGNGEARCDVM